MAEEIPMLCPKCGHRYGPNPAGSRPITCGCGVGYRASVTVDLLDGIEPLVFVNEPTGPNGGSDA